MQYERLTASYITSCISKYAKQSLQNPTLQTYFREHIYCNIMKTHPNNLTIIVFSALSPLNFFPLGTSSLKLSGGPSSEVSSILVRFESLIEFPNRVLIMYCVSISAHISVCWLRLRDDFILHIAFNLRDRYWISVSFLLTLQLHKSAAFIPCWIWFYLQALGTTRVWGTNLISTSLAKAWFRLLCRVLARLEH